MTSQTGQAAPAPCHDGAALPPGPDWASGTVPDQEQIVGRHDEPVRSVAIFPDGARLLSGSWDDTARIWDLAGAQLPLVLRDHGRNVWDVAVSPRGDRIVTGGSDGVFLSRADGSILQRLTIGVFTPEPAFSCDGTLLAYETEPGSLRVVQTGDGTTRDTWVAHGTDHIGEIAFDPADPRRLVSGGQDDVVRLWSADGQALGVLHRHDGNVRAVAFDPTGRIVLSGGTDDVVRRRDLARGVDLPPLTGHENWVTSIAVSPGGRFIASGSWDNTLRIWDAATGRQLHRLSPNGIGNILSVAFSPDGRQIATGSEDGTVRLFTLQP